MQTLDITWHCLHFRCLPSAPPGPSERLRYLQNETAAVYVAAGNEKNATDFIPAASEVEAYFYPKALKENGVETLAETLVFIRSRSGKQEAECSLDLREELFADQSFLQEFGKLTQSTWRYLIDLNHVAAFWWRHLASEVSEAPGTSRKPNQIVSGLEDMDSEDVTSRDGHRDGERDGWHVA